MIISKTNNYKVILTSNCIRQLQNELENFAYDYVCQFSVIPLEFYKKLNIGFNKKIPRGYFMVSRSNKVTIYNRIVNRGIIYNSSEVKKIISFVLINPNKEKFIPESKNNYYDVAQNKINQFRDIHEEIQELNKSIVADALVELKE